MTTYKDLVGSYVKATKAELEIKSMIAASSNNTVKFPAFLTDISQDFKSTWNTETVYGRNDPLGTFQGTTRTVSLTWDVPSLNLEDAKNNHVKFSRLITFLYPAYLHEKGGEATDQSKPRTILAKSPLVKVKFANVIQAQDGKGLLGWIDGINWKPSLDLGMFSDGDNFYAKHVQLSFTLNVLHQKDIGFDQNGNWMGSRTNFPFRLD